MSIFISVISYRDLELEKTIHSLINNADYPNELYFGIVTQDQNSRHPEFEYVKNLKHIKMHFSEAKGAGYARKLAMELYEEEDFYLQIDSHMRFAKGWDTKLKNMLIAAQEIAETDKVILSQFPEPYVVHSNGKDFFPKGDEDFWDEPSWTSVMNWSGVWAGKRNKIEDKTKPHKSHTVLAGLVFAPGKIVKEIPYDERICFMGEELCFAIRAYTRNWEIYAPNETVSWHFYKRKDSPKIWKDNLEKRQWSNLELASQKVQENVLLGIEQGIYGIGDKKRYDEYQEMIGISFSDYYKNSLQRNTNLSLIIEEIGPEGFIRLAGFCLNEFHEECHVGDECECSCHEGKRNVRNW